LAISGRGLNPRPEPIDEAIVRERNHELDEIAERHRQTEDDEGSRPGFFRRLFGRTRKD